MDQWMPLIFMHRFPHLTPSMDMLDKDHGALDGMFANVRQAFQANDLSGIACLMAICLMT